MGLPIVKKRVARFDLYERGLKIENQNRKSGFTHTFRKPADENDKILIPKGATYYEWHRKGMPVQRSLTYPTFPVLKSEYQTNLEEFIERKDNLYDESEKEELINDIESYKEELESRLSNMPYQLQENSILNERIEELEDLISELNDLEIEEN